MEKTEREKRIEVLELMKCDGMCTDKQLQELQELKKEQFYSEY